MEQASSQILGQPTRTVDGASNDPWAAAPPINILLIEDDDLDAELLSRRLNSSTDHTFLVHREGGLLDGLTALTYHDFDCVVLDLSLPDASGLSGCDTILSHPSSTPLVILTGVDDEHIAVEAVMRGAQDFLTKDDTTSASLERAIRLAVARDDSKRHDLHGIITGELPLRLSVDRPSSAPADRSEIASKLVSEVLDALDPSPLLPTSAADNA